MSPGVAHIALLFIVILSILLMLIRLRNMPEVYWVGSSALLLALLRLVSLKLAGTAVAEGSERLRVPHRHDVTVGTRERACRLRVGFVRSRARCKRIDKTPVHACLRIGTMTTIFMSNDAAAVVLTPAIPSAVRKAKVDPLPHFLPAR